MGSFYVLPTTQSMVCINSDVTKINVFFVHDKMKVAPKKF